MKKLVLMDVERLEDYIELYLNVFRNSSWNDCGHMQPVVSDYLI